ALYVKADARLRPGLVVAVDDPDPRVELAARIGDAEAEAYLAAMPTAYARAFGAAELAHHRDLVAAGTRAVDWTDLPDERLRAIVVEPDRTGLLATAAGALALVGFDI